MAGYSPHGGSMRFYMIRFLCAVAMAFSFLACEEAGQIRFNEISFDFGTLSQMETAKHVFTFTNDGPETLQIKDIHPD